VDAVLGPDRRGVIRLADVPRGDLEYPLVEAGLPSATPVELGLRLPGPAHPGPGPTAPGPGDPSELARYVAVALRRPAVVRLDGGWAVARADGELSRGPDAAALCVHAAALPPLPRVAVFGGAWIAEDDPLYGDILRLGRWLGERGAHLVCGGYQGAMAASCRGVAEAGGTAVGVTIYEWADLVEPNRWLTHEVIARDLFSRLPVITDADAWVAFSGGVGTLQEVALCWHLVQNALAAPRPLLLVGEGWDRQLGLFRELLRVSDPAHFDLVRPLASVEDVIPVLDPLIEPV
jgi:uncharacterized protein (TIGR00730 family)